MSDLLSLYTLDDFIEATIRLRKAVEWLRKAKGVTPIKLPFSIEGLDDPTWNDYQEQEKARLDRIAAAKDEIEAAAKALRDIEAYLVWFRMPFGVWVLHEYQERLFGIGVAYDHSRKFPKRVMQIHLIDHEDDLKKYPPLRWGHRSLALVSEWERTARANLRG